MIENNITRYVAEKTITLKSQNACLSFVHLIWRDKPLLILYNNLDHKISEILLNPVLQEEDEVILTGIVKEFLT